MLIRLLLLLCIGLLPSAVSAAEAPPLHIGILSARPEGKGGALNSTAVRRVVEMAIADFGGKAVGRPVRIVEGDHQNRPKVGALIARHWLQHGKADVILDVPNTSVQKAVLPIVKEFGGLMIVNGVGYTPPQSCSPHLVVWTYDLTAMTRFAFAALKEEGYEAVTLLNLEPPAGHESALGALVKAADYPRFETIALGERGKSALSRPKRQPAPPQRLLPDNLAALHGEDMLVAVGGKPSTLRRFVPQLREEIGAAKLPQIVCLACAGLLSEPDVLALAEKIYFVLPYDAAGTGLMSFVARYKADNHGQAPTMNQIGLYTATQAYLRAVDQSGKAQPAAEVGRVMRVVPQQDTIFGNSSITAAGIRRGTHYLYAYDTAAGTLDEVARQDISGEAAKEGCVADAVGASKP